MPLAMIQTGVSSRQYKFQGTMMAREDYFLCIFKYGTLYFKLGQRSTGV